MNEIWKPIKGYEDLYEVSNMGSVKVLPRVQSHWAGGTMTHKSKILKLTKCKTGYLMIYLSKNKKRNYHAVHRLVAINFLENNKNLPEVNHKDGVKTNNIVSNLEWCDRKYNNRHAIETGLLVHVKGEQHGNSVLTNEDVLKIREIYSTGTLSQEKIGVMFGVGDTAICKIISGKAWKHI